MMLNYDVPVLVGGDLTAAIKQLNRRIEEAISKGYASEERGQLKKALGLGPLVTAVQPEPQAPVDPLPIAGRRAIALGGL